MDSTDRPESTAAPSSRQRFTTRLDTVVSRLAARLRVSARLVRVVIVSVTLLAVVAAIAVPVAALALTAAPVPVPAVTTAASASPSPLPLSGSTLSSTSCEEFLNTADVATVLGSSTEVAVEPSELLLSAVGGLDCWYSFGEPLAGAAGYAGPKDSAYVSVTVAPSSIADPAVVDASLAPTRCAPQNHIPTRWSAECRATVSLDGWWYTLKVTSFAPVSELRTSFDAITDLVTSSLSAVAAPDQSQVVSPFDCASADVGEVPVVALPREYPMTSEITTAAYLLAAPTTCQFAMPGNELWNFRVYPGAAQAYERCTLNNWRGLAGYPVAIDGVMSAFAFEPQTNDLGTELCASDGASTINVWRSLPYGSNRADFGWSDELRVALGELLVPVFAATVASTSALVADPTVVAGGPLATSSVSDGGCVGLFDAATLETLTGGELESENVGPEHPLLATVGGISCHYWAQDDEGNGRGYALVSVAPSSITAPNVVTASLASAQCPSNAIFNRVGDPKCTVTAVTDGWWYTITLGGISTADGLRTTFAAATASLESTLATAEAPERPGATTRFDCESADVTAQSVGGWRYPDNQYRRASAQPGITPAMSAMSAAAFLLRGPSTCQYTVSSGEDWELTVYPAGASVYTQCTQVGDALPGSSVSVDGVSSAYIQPHLNDAATLCATDGISLIEVSRPFAFDYAEDARNWSAADLAILSELLVPVFAAAK